MTLEGSWDWKRGLAECYIVGRDLPDVRECYGQATHKHTEGDSCSQCDGQHAHRWVRCIVINGGWPDIATRCLSCGGRKCDNAGCSGRRHHPDAHIYANGRIQEVGK